MTQTPKPSILRRLMKGVATILVTGVFIGIAGASVWQGSTYLAERAAAVERPEPTEPVLVSVQPIEMQSSYEVVRSFTGQIEAPQTANLSFEQGGKLAAVLVDEGQTVQEGQVLAKLDDRLLRADLDRLAASKQAIEAQMELARLTDERQSKLQERGFASAQIADQTRINIAELNARLAEIDASITSANLMLEKSEIIAPFSGIVNQRLVDPGNTVGVGQAVVALVEDGDPILRVGVDPKLVEDMGEGETLSVAIENATYTAEVIGVLPQIDPATRTRIVRAKLKDGGALAIGQTGSVLVTELAAETGAWIPLTALEDGVRGLWTIKTVTQGDAPTVGIEAVELIHTDSKRAYVRGTFSDGMSFIDEGIHRVAAGQTVKVQQ